MTTILGIALSLTRAAAACGAAYAVLSALLWTLRVVAGA